MDYPVHHSAKILSHLPAKFRPTTLPPTTAKTSHTHNPFAVAPFGAKANGVTAATADTAALSLVAS